MNRTITKVRDFIWLDVSKFCEEWIKCQSSIVGPIIRSLKKILYLGHSRLLHDQQEAFALLNTESRTVAKVFALSSYVDLAFLVRYTLAKVLNLRESCFKKCGHCFEEVKPKQQYSIHKVMDLLNVSTGWAPTPNQCFHSHVVVNGLNRIHI